jgi:hypothetical protein
MRQRYTMFTGGDPGITSALKEMWEKEDLETSPTAWSTPR